MFRKIYLSPLGYLISIFMISIGRIFRPFMVYGYWNSMTGEFRRFTRISSSCVLIDKRNIDIGDSCWIGHHSIIDGSNGVKIGRGVQIAGLTGIYSHSSHVAIRLYGDQYIRVSCNDRQGYVRSPVEIGDFSFIGVSAVVLPGVKVGRGCIIAAGAVLSCSIPDFSIAAGNPAKVIGSTLDMDKEFFNDPLVQQNYFDPEIIKKYKAESESLANHLWNEYNVKS